MGLSDREVEMGALNRDFSPREVGTFVVWVS